MQIHKGTCAPGDVLTLRLLEGVDRQELMELLAAEGIEIEVLETGPGAMTFAIRAPSRLMVLKEKAGQNT